MDSERPAPFSSERLLSKVMEKAGIQGAIKYREYLVERTECARLHTELGYLYIKVIQLSQGPESHGDVGELEGKLHQHLVTSKFYSARSLLAAIDTAGGTDEVVQLLIREKAILYMRAGRFADCFDHCIRHKLQEDHMLHVAELGLEWHKGNEMVYYHLFTSLLEAG